MKCLAWSLTQDLTIPTRDFSRDLKTKTCGLLETYKTLTLVPPLVKVLTSGTEPVHDAILVAVAPPDQQVAAAVISSSKQAAALQHVCALKDAADSVKTRDCDRYLSVSE